MRRGGPGPLENTVRPFTPHTTGFDDALVRPAGVDDRQPLLELWERSVRATHHFLTEDDVVALRPHVAVALASDALDWWVLDGGAGTPIGFLGVAGDDVAALFVDPDHHGRGAGKLLVAHAQRLVGDRALTVDVNEQNGSARGFYESLGFAVVGRSPTDSDGRPFPIVHMRRAAPGAAAVG
jgi:putative acetyltransferase